MSGNRAVLTEVVAAIGVGLLILFTIFMCALAEAKFHLSGLSAVLQQDAFLKFIAAAILSVILGIASSFAHGWIRSTGAKAELNRIENLTDPDLYKSILKTMKNYGHKICLNRSIHYRLDATANDKLLQVTGVYRYSRKRDERRLAIRFVRLRNTAEQASHSVATRDGLPEYLRNTELHFVVDELDMREELGIDDRNPALDVFYSVRDFRINGLLIPLMKTTGVDLEYFAMVPRGIPRGAEMLLEYTMAFPITYSDWFFSDLSLPTNGNDISLNYSAVSSKIWTDVSEVYSAIESAVSVERDKENGILRVAHSGWAIPRSGVMFMWSKL